MVTANMCDIQNNIIVRTKQSIFCSTFTCFRGGDRVRRGDGDRVQRGGGDRVRKGGDETVATAGDETAANGGVMYADEGPYKIDVRHVEEMEGTTREAADCDRVRWGRYGDETGDEIGGPRDETGDKTAGDERDDGDLWGNVYGRRGVRI